MPWFKVDDSFHGHPKVTNLSTSAVGLWLLAGTWCANYLTDGVISERSVNRLGGTSEEIAELLQCGLWEQSGSDYQFHDWAQYQPMKAHVERERETARDRMRGVRAAKKGVQTNSDGTPPEVQTNSDGTPPEVRSTPALPDPTGPALPERSKERVGARGTRLPESFDITDKMREWARLNAPSIHVDQATEIFRDYWRASAAPSAVKKDWVAAWQVWLRRDEARVPPNQKSKPKKQFKAHPEDMAAYRASTRVTVEERAPDREQVMNRGQ